ncbi:hypothetical protein EX30DRAFT_351806 [Ascodesmis nigricans]|uniref:Uncharacterized protein n=1 Tax=Ascodesmis nigricans TaxID=341454 RepID=A0A4S2MKC7_9PEZI|nr:hypothetical protein EX30DRAFT_351806 [Ascodesmis nigricans]
MVRHPDVAHGSRVGHLVWVMEMLTAPQLKAEVLMYLWSCLCLERVMLGMNSALLASCHDLTTLDSNHNHPVLHNALRRISALYEPSPQRFHLSRARSCTPSPASPSPSPSLPLTRCTNVPTSKIFTAPCSAERRTRMYQRLSGTIAMFAPTKALPARCCCGRQQQGGAVLLQR